MKENKLIISSVIVMLLSITFVMGMLDTEAQLNANNLNGIEIDYPKFSNLQNNQPFNLSIHAYNESNGLELTSINCLLNIYNKIGNNILTRNLIYTSSGYNIYLTSGNFTQNALYSFNIYCNASDLGGFASGNFKVSNTGNEFNTSQGLIFFLIDFLLIFLFLGCVYGAIVTPFKNERSGSGEEIAKVNWKKYLKIFLIGLAYMFLVALVFVTWTLIYAYAQWSTLGKFFYYLYRLLMVGAMLLAPVGFVLLVMNYFNDKKIDSSLKKGVPVYR